MTPTTFEQQLQALLRRDPFLPFIIELDDGERLVVGQREALMYREGGTAIYFRLNGEFDFVDCGTVKQFLELAIKTSA